MKIKPLFQFAVWTGMFGYEKCADSREASALCDLRRSQGFTAHVHVY